MFTTAKRITALYLVLRYDCQLYQRRRGISARALSMESGIPDRLLRGMDSPSWKPSLQTLIRIQDANSGHEKWPELNCERVREIGDDTGFVMRRIHADDEDFEVQLDDTRESHFSEALGIWRSDMPDDRKLDELLRFENATMIDTSPFDPREFRILRHSDVSKSAGGMDGSGLRLGGFRSKNYSEAAMSDYMMVSRTGVPQLADVIWFQTGTDMGAFYQRICLPVGRDRVVTMVQILREKFTGEVEYAASISLLEE